MFNWLLFRVTDCKCFLSRGHDKFPSTSFLSAHCLFDVSFDQRKSVCYETPEHSTCMHVTQELVTRTRIFGRAWGLAGLCGTMFPGGGGEGGGGGAHRGEQGTNRGRWRMKQDVMPYNAIPYHAIPYHTMPCHAMPYHAMPYHAMPYHTIPCHAMPCHAMPCHAIPYHTIPCHTIPCHAMPYHAIPCHAIPYHTIPYHTIPYHTITYHTIPYHAIPRHVWRRMSTCSCLPLRILFWSLCLCLAWVDLCFASSKKSSKRSFVCPTPTSCSTLLDSIMTSTYDLHVSGCWMLHVMTSTYDLHVSGCWMLHVMTSTYDLHVSGCWMLLFTHTPWAMSLYTSLICVSVENLQAIIGSSGSRDIFVVANKIQQRDAGDYVLC